MFGEGLSTDIIFLEGKAVLHVVDKATLFCATTFLYPHGAEIGQFVDKLWLAFVMNWCLIYTGCPNKLCTDQGSVFTSACWKQLTILNVFQLRLSEIEAHSSLGIVERYHEPLRSIYRKLRYAHQQVLPP